MSTPSTTPVALVTGGGSGIGRATALLLVERGYDVVVTGRSESSLAATVALAGERCSSAVADMSVPEQARGVVEQVGADRGRLDALVNAHGILGATKPLVDLAADEVLEALGTNLLGPIMATQAAVPLLEATRGAVVNVVSINALQAEPDAVPYGVSKTGLLGFTRYAAVELAARGVRVNAVLPGWVMTPMVDDYIAPLVADGTFAANVMRRPAEPSEIAGVIAFLASPAASFMTGSCVVADGGQSMTLAPVS